MCFNIFSNVNRCCHCIRDLKTASAIIAVLAIVTSPAIAWAIIRHSYVVRVSCFITTTSLKDDVIDVNLNNIISFGFGSNAGLGPSCFQQLSSNLTKLNQESHYNNYNGSLDNSTVKNSTGSIMSPNYAEVIKWIGWSVLIADLLFIIFSLLFLVSLYQADGNAINTITRLFLCSGTLATFLSFVYGMLYVITCMFIGGNFPLFEFGFAFFDLIVWMYFLTVVNTYRRTDKPVKSDTIITDEENAS